MKEGDWWLTSESDSRWNASGKAIVGGLSCPLAALAHIEKMKKVLSAEPPADLTYGYMKD